MASRLQAPVPRTPPNGAAAPRAAGLPLTVCTIAACPFPANHGTPGSIREMAEALADAGHRVHVVTYHYGEDIPVRGPTLHRIPALFPERGVVVGPTGRRPLYDLQLVFTALGVIRDHRPDLIHAHGYEAGLAACLCRLATGLPVVYSGHNTMADELPSYRFIRPKWLATGLARLLDAVVPRLGTRCLPHSSNIDRFFRSMGLGGRVEPVVNFGIDVSAMAGGDGAAVRRRYNLGTDPVVVYAGVLDEFQRLDLLLDAMRTVTQRVPQARLLVVVTIPCARHEAAVRERARELGIADRVILTEPQPLAAVRDCLAAADVAVVPRPGAPGFPIKLLNYMAARRPCVLFASSASAGLVHRGNALLAAIDTADALANAILELLRDPGLRERLGRAGHQYVRLRHDRAAIARQVTATYRRALAAAGRPLPLRAEPRLLRLAPVPPGGPSSETPSEVLCDVGA